MGEFIITTVRNNKIQIGMECEICKQSPVQINCSKCETNCCPKCAVKLHIAQHIEKVSIVCQECQENSASNYCHNCEQHLCAACSQRIHNKAKRAKHTLTAANQDIFRLRECYLLCSDVILGRQVYLQEIMSQILNKDEKYPYEVLILYEGSELPATKKYALQLFRSDQLDNEKLSALSNRFPCISKINIVQSISSAKLMQKLGKQTPFGGARSVNLPQFYFDSNDSFGNTNSVNLSTSTENSIRKRTKKSPIPYYQPWLTSKNDRKRGIQQKYRFMAANGTLMIRRQNCKQFDEYVTREFSRNIGQSEVEYVSMHVDSISVECISWILSSIKADKMTPSQKLILSRLKESYDYKVNTKLWQQILKYFQSNLYNQDMMEKDANMNIPQIVVELQGEEHVLFFENQSWIYEDQGLVDQKSKQWQQFVTMLHEYFLKNSQISGGRYGCVQYIKMQSQKPLQECSLGKLSLFVQEAINKGVIRYHKTLLVSNNDSQSFINNQSMQMDSKLIHLQKDIKILTLQITLVDMFLDCGKGTQISLAQIPLNLKKNVPFEVNLVDLGFPKLKNLLSTLSDKLTLQTTKSHVYYDTHKKTNEILQEQKINLQHMRNILLTGIIEHIVQIMQYFSNIVVEELYNQLNHRLGFIFDFKIFNIADFYQFIMCYCSHLMDVQFISGVFLVFTRTIPNMYAYGSQQSPTRHHHQNPQSHTPKFNESLQFETKKLGNLNWQSFQQLLVQSPEHQQEEVQGQFEESDSNFKDIENILCDDSELNSKPSTFIVNKSVANDLIFGSNLTSIKDKSQMDGKSQGLDFERQFLQMNSPRAQNHARVYSTAANEAKTFQHKKVASTLPPKTRN